MSSSDDVIFPLGNPRVFYLAPHNIVYLVDIVEVCGLLTMIIIRIMMDLFGD